jgi:hypothetical protein
MKEKAHKPIWQTRQDMNPDTRREFDARMYAQYGDNYCPTPPPELQGNIDKMVG